MGIGTGEVELTKIEAKSIGSAVAGLIFLDLALELRGAAIEALLDGCSHSTTGTGTGTERSFVVKNLPSRSARVASDAP